MEGTPIDFGVGPQSATRGAQRTGGDSVAVIGGGIGGLSAAHYHRQAGVDVTLFEASDRYGGLGTFFEHHGTTLDRFYHVLLPTDDALLALCEELGCRDRVYWREASLGFLHDGDLYPLCGPLDLLRFRPVPVRTRLRLGLTALYAAHVAGPEGLDGITVGEWLRKISGPLAFERLWKPLLQAKFGDAYRKIPALWYWASFNREKGTGKEVKGYLEGGYRGLTRTLVRSLEERGAELHRGTPVEHADLAAGGGVELTVDGTRRRFDRVVSTLPPPLLHEMVAGGELERVVADADLDVDYQGVVNVVVLLERGLTPHYWIPVVECDVPFRGIVETTRVLDLEDTGGHHLAYLLNYVHRSEPLFQRDDEEIREAYLEGLFRLFPDLDREDVTAAYVFRAPFVEPLYTPGYASRKPPVELVPDTFYLVTTAQVYPEVTSWNNTVDLVQGALETILPGTREAA